MIIDHNPIRTTLRQELAAIRWFFASQCNQVPSSIYFPAPRPALFGQNCKKFYDRIHWYANKIFYNSSSNIIRTGNRKPVTGWYGYLLSQENQRIARQLLPRNAVRMGL